MKHYHKNPRRMSKDKFNKLKAWLEEYGDLSGIVHNIKTDELIGGNQRAEAMGFFVSKTKPTITYKYKKPTKQGTVATGFFEWQGDRYSYRQVSWNEKKSEGANIIANLASGEWDMDMLSSAFKGSDLIEWGFDNALLKSMKNEMAGILDLLESEKPEEMDAEPEINRADELQKKWKTKTGQLWQLGEHRLLCGDSTEREDVERVVGGEKIEMVWEDPPYGVGVGDKNKYLNSIAPSNRIEENLQNDTLDENGLVEMLCKSFDNTIEFCTAGAGWYVAAPPGPLHVLFGQVLKERAIWRQTIQWVKNNSTFSPMGVCYHWQAEPIFFGWLPNGPHRYYGGRTQTTVWNIDRPVKSPEHPTMKPVGLVQRAIENSSLFGEIVFDGFVGSGTTLVACQNLGRKGRAIEISPAYCAVTLQRMQDAFPSLEIKLIESRPASKSKKR